MQPTLIRPSEVAIILLMAILALPAARAGETPYGHKDFYPSPERPVGWRADGNGTFPGATPVPEWREGTVAMEEQEVALWGDAGGNQRGQFAKRKIPVFKDQQSVNIVWKIEMPGFANSQPIVVGDRVFTTAEPDRLVCVDVHTGKILWEKVLDPFELMGQPPEEAKKNRQLMELSVAASAVYYSITGNYQRIPEKIMLRDMPVWRADLAELREALTNALPIDTRGDIRKTIEYIDQVLPKMDEILARKDRTWSDEEVKAAAQSLTKPMKSILGEGMIPFQRIAAWMVKEYEIHPNHHWDGWVGWTFGAPVSDGKHVFVTFGQRQAACFDLNGNRVWARMVPLPAEMKRKSFHAAQDLGQVCSPVLADGVLVMPFAVRDPIVGLDATTGKTLWELAAPASFASHKVLRLADGTAALVRNNGQIVRIRNGRLLLTQPECAVDKFTPATIMGHGDTFFIANRRKIESNGPCHLEAYRVKPKPDGLETELVWQYPKEGKADLASGLSAVLTDKYVVHPKGMIFDTVTGNRLDSQDKSSKSGEALACLSQGGHSSPILAGDCVLAFNTPAKRNTLRGMLDNSGNVMCQGWVLRLGADGTLTKVSDNNWLGGDNKPRMPILEKFIPQAYKRGIWAKEGGAIPDQFGFGSPFAQGNRVFLRSCSHLYCIGDPKIPYDWNPASRPQDISQSLTQ